VATIRFVAWSRGPVLGDKFLIEAAGIANNVSVVGGMVGEPTTWLTPSR
jgi:hypothetical protein